MISCRARSLSVSIACLFGAVLVSCSDGNDDAASGLTSCVSVMHIGDSLTAGMMSPAVSSNPNDLLDSQYRRVGVTDPRVDGSSGRTIHEINTNSKPGAEVAVAARAAGYTGCWVIALGTNDSALIFDGSAFGARQRIDEMMAIIGGEPVMWSTTITVVAEGSYGKENMKLWNTALRDAQGSYPNMKLYDWAGVAKPEWFSPDGIHYTPEGFLEMARRIPDGLAAAFPG